MKYLTLLIILTTISKFGDAQIQNGRFINPYISAPEGSLGLNVNLIKADSSLNPHLLLFAEGSLGFHISNRVRPYSPVVLAPSFTEYSTNEYFQFGLRWVPEFLASKTRGFYSMLELSRTFGWIRSGRFELNLGLYIQYQIHKSRYFLHMSNQLNLSRFSYYYFNATSKKGIRTLGNRTSAQ